MALPWVRLDSNILTHDKMLALLSDPSAKRWQAATSYMFSLAWAGGAGTDGWIPRAALSVVQGTNVTARLLVKHGLWDEGPTGWKIRNYEQRQELTVVTAGKRAAQSMAARKTNCLRWHGKECGCWRASA
jgi:ribonuclease I